jgi:tetratricopeptide (TPR) repeat protein
VKRLYALGITYLVAVLGLTAQDVLATIRAIALESTPSHATRNAPSTSTGSAWFAQVKPRCNALEAAVHINRNPPPVGRDGAAYAASCYALAGKFEDARGLIDALPDAKDREHAAGIVFGIGHPVADMGDDESAGPIMELVIAYQPNNYMALYHAGMSQFILGQYEKSGVNMRRFLEIYKQKDSWRSNAEKVLRRLAEAK